MASSVFCARTLGATGDRFLSRTDHQPERGWNWPRKLRVESLRPLNTDSTVYRHFPGVSIDRRAEWLDETRVGLDMSPLIDNADAE